MSIRVPHSGPWSARVAVLAEAPAGEEERLGRPLVGPTGQLWDRWLREFGLRRADWWIDNVSQVRAPGNKVELMEKADRAMWAEDVHERLAKLDDPWLLILMGKFALQAVLNLDSIVNWRGSVLEYTDRRGRRIKCIPTIHPAAVFQVPTWERRCRHDWGVTIRREMQSKAIELPLRDLGINPTLRDIADFTHDEAETTSLLSLDIETPRKRIVTLPTFPWACSGCGQSGETMDASMFHVDKLAVGKVLKSGALRMKNAVVHGDNCGPVTTGAMTGALKPRVIEEKVTYGPARVTCVGFASSPTRSLTIPTTIEFWRDASRLRKAWDAIRYLCGLPVAKTLQNGLFDTFYLAADHNIEVRSWLWDTLALHHAIDPVEDHDLAFITSMYTRENYYKDDIKAASATELGERTERIFDPDTFQRYNGKDCCVTWEATPILIDILQRRHRMDGPHGWVAKYRALFRPLLDMMLRGVPIDRGSAALEYDRLVREHALQRAMLTAWTGVELFGPKGGTSYKKMQGYLYDELQLPKQWKVDKATSPPRKKLTTDDTALRTIAIKAPPAADLCLGILDCRSTGKLAEFFHEDIIDPDDRVRCSYRFTTEAMRLASAENPKRTGANLTNQPNEPRLRRVYRAEPGHLWMKLDASQIENRIVNVLSKDPALIERAMTKPWEFNEHSFNGAVIFGRPIDKYKDPVEYKVAKISNHGFQRGMGPQTLANELLGVGVARTVKQCQGYLDRLRAAAPGIERYFLRIRMEAFSKKKLVNSWGDEWDITFERMNADLYRRAYSFKPQSNCGQLVKQYGIVYLANWFKAAALDARLLVQVYDELGISVHPDVAWEVYQTAKRSLERPVDYEGIAMGVPIELGLGWSWAPRIEFPKPPSRDEFMAAVERLLAEGPTAVDVAA